MESGENNNELPAAILTPAQREYLLGKRETTDSGERAIKSRIRKRLRTALVDINTLVRNLDPEDRKTALKDITDIQDYVIAAIGFFYLVLDDVDDSPSTDSAFAILAEKGIEAALVRDGVSVNDVEITVEVDRGGSLEDIPTDDLPRRDRQELQQLLVNGTITQDEFADAIRAKREDENPTDWKVE